VDTRYLFERYESTRNQAMKDLRAGKHDVAREGLLKSAELLLRLAAAADGRLRESRKANAAKLVELAKKVESMPPPGDGRRGDASAGVGGGESGDKPDGDVWRLAERPTTQFADIAGLEEVKDAISIRMILPIQHPERAQRFGVSLGGGVLLYGPPGTGKTMLARAIAGEIDAPFFTVSPADILSRWVGDAEKNIQAIFDAAREHPLAIIFIDEIEAMLPRRDAVESPVMQRLVPQVLSELEGIDKDSRNPLLFVGATNKPWALDEAVLRPGRFDEQVYVPLPDGPARQAILWSRLKERPLADDVDIDRLVTKTAGYSGADLVGLVAKVLGDAFRRSIEADGDIDVTASDFDAALARVKPSVTQPMLERYAEFAAKGPH
jgi:transitional endoplasmic reticulum ATPase